jgi:type IV pilus secretin PilQ/predicted competence protein
VKIFPVRSWCMVIAQSARPSFVKYIFIPALMLAAGGCSTPKSQVLSPDPGSELASAEVVAPTTEELVASLDSPEAQAGDITTATATNETGSSSTESLEPKLIGLSLEIFSLAKTAPSEFVMTLEGAKAEPQAMRTLVSPPDGGLIRSVRPVQQGENLLLRIFAQPDTDISASAAAGRIIISAEASESGPLAQLSDEATAASASGELSDAASGTAKPETVSELPTSAPSESEISALLEGEPKYTGRLISLDLQDTDIDNALRIIAEVSNLNIITSDNVTGKVTLRLVDVPWDQALDVILKTNGLDKVQEGNVVRIAPLDKLRSEREALKEAQRADEDLQPLMVRYIRISYAKASEVKTLVEAVLTERGTVAVDERTNQIIVKDIQKGVQNVVELVQKLDLRTPQVLLETQIVEANRSFLRDLGSEFGFDFTRSPETGNATGYNFPNSISVGGSQADTGNTGGAFPAAVKDAGSAITALFASADGTKSVGIRLSALEKEGRVRVVSRPSVATINNKKATIKSVEKIRVKTPDSGLSVATGEGAAASGASAVATESFEVGIVLDVTPQASPDYYVLLDINAKSSTLGTTQVDEIPSEIERSATSTVLVSSGQTFALGGIYKIIDSDSISGVPFLKDIPVFGSLFRRTLIDDKDEELIFFITPRIVEGSFDDAAMKSTL